MNINKIEGLELVIFDLDGTLIDSNGVHNMIDIEVVRSLGEEKSDEEIIAERNYILKNSKAIDIYLDYCDELRKKYNTNLSKDEIIGRRRKLLNKYSREIKFKKDADTTIKYLKNNGLKLALATVSRKRTLDIYDEENENIKNKCKLQDYFDLIITKDDVTLKKPNPEVYNKIIESFNVTDLNKCIVVEDSLSGILAAKNAKLKVIAMYDKYNDKDREKINELSDYQVANFQELMELLNSKL